jgi:general secretion pathway protein L
MMALAFARPIADGVSRWTDSVAEVVVATLAWFVRPRRVQLIEQDDGAFSVRMGGNTFKGERIRISGERLAGSIPPALANVIKGSRVELVLRPSRFLFRPLQLPGRATEFLEGVVRAQIDRLTPWATSDAVFGWSKGEVANDRMTLTIAATSRAQVSPLVQAVAELGAASIAVFATAEGGGPDDARIKVFDQDARGMLDVRRVSRALLVILVACGATAALSFSANVIVGDYLQDEQRALSQRISGRRAAIRAGDDAAGRSAIETLERRKHETVASVIVLETLSRVLPDHTYITELRIEGSKVQLIGVTQDAPGLIRLLEQSRRWTRATFFAPTTRSPADPGERFHIEARIEPPGSPRT